MSTDNMISHQGELYLWYSDSPGTLNNQNNIVYSSPYVIYLGHINKISESYSKSTTTVPLVTLGAANAFPLDGGTGRTYSFNGSRQQPDVVDDVSYPSTKLSNALPTESETSRWDYIRNHQYTWSCKKWIMELQAFIDRWQMKTDGCFVLFRPTDTNPYVRLGPNSEGYYKNMIHGYLKSIEFTYNAEFNESITYYITMTVGTCRSSAYVDEVVESPYTSGEEVAINDSSIACTDKTRKTTYLLGSLAGTITYEGETVELESAVDKYTITGGPNQPFETLNMTLPKTKLKKIMGNYIDTTPTTYLVEGQNLVLVNAVGAKRTFTLSSVKSSGGKKGNIKIQGRSLAYKFKTSANQSDQIVGLPFGIIKSILYAGKYGPPYSTNNFKYLIRKEYVPDSENANPADILKFNKGRSVWDILQICAISIKAKLFFIGDNAYLIDYTIPFDDYTNNLYLTNLNSAELFRYTEDNATMLTGDSKAAIWVFPDTLPNSNVRTYMSGRLVGDCTYENQGVDTVTQTVTVNCLSPTNSVTEGSIYTEYDEVVCVKYTDPEAKAWNENNGNPDEEYGVIFDLDDLLEGTDATTGIVYTQGINFAKNYIEYMLEPQQPVSFKVRESTGTSWKMLFPYLAQADSFLDESDDLGYITNVSIYDDSIRVPQKLCLSTYEFNYPEMATTYTWGVVNNIDLSGRLADRF